MRNSAGCQRRACGMTPAITEPSRFVAFKCDDSGGGGKENEDSVDVGDHDGIEARRPLPSGVPELQHGPAAEA
ncbi:hypothetical protein E2C01_024715 [Portunus trituberculatus]|uniref:Uncharacterized protein n=1 Tax=Portunus trituberculatus TaxID=210409 RepID=A0A5B7EDX7_PORTR|nr:hypothetical protein [Portunus trituberculatus]